MATRVVDRAVVDTNVLLAATDESRSDHEDAVVALNEWPAAGTVLYASGQILREYLVVATRPADQNGLGLTRTEALTNVRELRGRLSVLVENVKVTERLLALLQETECAGKQIHDANVIATMLVHGVDTVVTANVSDFARFERHVRVLMLRQ
jgi:predicted nucleic acid-binding protein